MSKSFLLSTLVQKFGGSLHGPDVLVSGISSLKKASVTELSFLADSRLKDLLAECAALAIIVDNNFTHFIADKSYILTTDPYLYYARVANLFYPKKNSSGIISETAVLGTNTKFDHNVEIGPHVTLGNNVKIGANTRILANSVIEDDVQIGANCLIHSSVTINHGCLLGNEVEIHSGAVIGADGFGQAWNGKAWEKIPQIGIVEISNQVEIGANTTIDRGAIENTLIGEGVKIDNLVQIAHNCEIGDHTAIAAMVGMAGGTKIGRFCRIAGAAKFTGHLAVADFTFIAGDTIVSHSIEETNQQYAGSYPIQKYKEWKRNAIYIRHLKEMMQRIKELENKINKLN